MTNSLKLLVPSLFLFASACSKSSVDGQTATPEECAGIDNTGSKIGEACDVSSDCGSDFLFCHVGLCAAPDDPALLCDGGSSPLEGYECGPLGYLVPSSLNCDSDLDCANGYSCTGGTGTTCVADADACPDRDEPMNLRGNWTVDTTLHLREALGSTGGTIADVAQIIRDIKNGDLDSNSEQLKNIIPSSALRASVVSIANNLGSEALDKYLSDDALKVADILGAVADVMEDTKVSMKIDIGGKACDYSYRGKATWEKIKFELAGEPYEFIPSSVAAVGMIESEEFTVMNACGMTYFDQARYYNVVSKVPSAIVEFAVRELTSYEDIDEALNTLIDCQGFATNDEGDVSIFKKATCDALVSAVVDYGKGKLNDLGENLKVLTLKGYAEPQNGKVFTEGVWRGTVVGAGFSGEFSGKKN